MNKSLSTAQNAALNIVLSSIERRTGRAWQFAERDCAAKLLRELPEFALPQAAAVAWKLTGKVIAACGC